MDRLRDISIRHKLLLIIMLTSGISLLLACVAFITYDWISTKESLAQRLETMAEIVGANSTAALTFDNVGDAEETLRLLRAESHVVAGAVYGGGGSPFATYHRDAVDFAPPEPEPAGYRFEADHLVVFRPILLDDDRIGTVFLQSDLEEMEARFRSYVQIVVVFILASFVLTFALGSRLRRVISEPILTLLQTMRRVSEERTYSVRANKQGEDELGHLIDGFNDMLAQIQERDEALLEAQGELSLRAGELQVELTERERAEARIRSSLEEKEVLLQEIHHRVKNNLQIVSSLLELQSSHLHDPAAVAMLSDSRNRVRSMALVHERLYQTENLADIALREYVPELCTDLRNSYLADAKGVALQVNVADISFDVDHAIPCGLIINELVSNAFKYAFPNSREGTVTVELAPTGLGGFELTVRDDGAGMPAELDFESPSTLGLQLVSALVGQLKGVIQVDRSAGTTIAITFGNPPDADG